MKSALLLAALTIIASAEQVPALASAHSARHGSSSTAGAPCVFESGEKRWPVKTSLAPGGSAAAASPVSLASLMALTNPTLSKSQRGILENRRWNRGVAVADKDGAPSAHREGDIVSVEGYLYRARCQQDGDYHLEIGTSQDRQTNGKAAPCLIVELPDPDQASDPALKDDLIAARAVLFGMDHSILTASPKAPVGVRITGQLFLDAPHIRANDPSGGRGTGHCATNVWEIHPVTEIDLLP